LAAEQITILLIPNADAVQILRGLMRSFTLFFVPGSPHDFCGAAD